MTKKEYRELLFLVNDPKTLELLHKYVDIRLATLRTFLEIEKDHSRILEVQGSIAELKKFKTLREEVLEGAK